MDLLDCTQKPPSVKLSEMSRHSRFFVIVLVFGTFLYVACTNIQLGQTSKRFYDNMSGGIPGFNNISPSNPNSFSFSALGDTHIGSPGGDRMIQALTMSKNDGDSFAVVAGDISNTGLESELTAYKAQIAQTAFTVFPAIGNHDIYFGGWNQYRSIIGRSIYSIDAGVAHIIFLDTANGLFGEEQLNWLRDDLTATTKAVKIVVMHFPIFIGEFSSLYKISSDEEATIFKSIMNEFRVNLVISGHYHGFGDKDIGGTKYVVTGATNSITELGHRSQYLKVTVTTSGVSYRQIWL